MRDEEGFYAEQQRCMNEGKEAFKQGDSISSNPYESRMLGDKKDYWRKGYQKARDEYNNWTWYEKGHHAYDAPKGFVVKRPEEDNFTAQEQWIKGYTDAMVLAKKKAALKIGNELWFIDIPEGHLFNFGICGLGLKLNNNQVYYFKSKDVIQAPATQKVVYQGQLNLPAIINF